MIAFNVYCRTPFGRLHARNPEIIEVAKTIGRTPDSLAMKCCNLAAFDSALKSRGIKGLSKASRLDAKVWKEFSDHPEEVAFESEQEYAKIMQRELRAEAEVRWEDVRGLDKSVITKVRVNQYFFRSMVLSGYRGQCAVCELPLPMLLVASHIVPWCVDKGERMNPQNGICLCNIHDRAFDKGLLSISGNFTISIHSTALKYQPSQSVQDFFLRFDGKKISLPDRWHPAPSLLQRHAELVARILR